MPETFNGHNLRVLQWNLLAEGLVPEGFMMPLVSQKHVERSDTYLEELLRKSGPEDLQNAARLASQGYRSFVWREGDGSSEGSWEEFARMACNMVLAMKGLAPSQKEERGLELKKMYNPDLDGKGTGQLTVNEKAIVGAEHRLFRVVWFVALLKPDIICLQELDNFTFLSKELQKLGYACSSVDAEAYVPLKDRTGSTYSEKLASSSWAFAPKTGFKKGKSTARHFLEKRVADGTGVKARFHGQDAWPVDDDGQAIFWRADRFQMVGKPEFQTLPGDPDIDAFVEGTSEVPGFTTADQAAVRVLLQFKELDERLRRQQFYVCTTHLSSGTDSEVRRIQQLHHLGQCWGRSGLPEIWSMDANTELDFDDADMTFGSVVPIPEEANALQSFMHNNDLRSIWEEFYSSTRDMWNPPVSVWKMRGSASAQPKKVGEDPDMYQLIDHIFYDGRHLFQLGEQALRLREKKTDAAQLQNHCFGALKWPQRWLQDHADRDWLALMPNELLPSDHLPIVWDFQLQIKSPRIESTVLLSTAEQLFNQLRPWLKPDDETLVEIEALFKPLYFAGALTAKTELGQLPDAAIDIFHALKKIADEAKVVLSYELVYGTSKLEDFRERIIAATGRHQSKATYECCLVEALLFSAAAVVAVGTQLLGDVRNLITLAAMRCIMRTFTAVPKADEQCVEIMSKGQLWALLAQLTSTIAPSCHHMVVALDNDGLVDPKDMNGLLGEIGEQLASRRTCNGPALCVLRCINWRQCATGSHVAAAVKMLFQAIESGKIPFLEQHMNNVPEEPPAGSASDAIKLLRTGSNSPKPSLLKNTPLEFLHKQTFDQSAAIAALSALAMSGNLDSGGGLALMLESLQRQIALVQGSQVPERQARALRRPPPWVVASFVRRAVVTACESLEPIDALLVSVQKLHVHEQAKKRAKVNPVEELIQALIELPQDGIQSQAHTFGRILRLLVKLCQRCGPAALLSPMVARSGSDRIRDVLRCLALLPADDLQRWKTHLQVNRFLDLLLHSDLKSDNLACALQQKIQDATEEPEFLDLLLMRPPTEIRSQKSFDLSKILDEIDKFEFVKTLSVVKAASEKAAAAPSLNEELLIPM
ncbi:abcG22 [Symbiodinium sp. CCMP2592]|nr:abcG22 [Symbiodinium sp. CCMP2592]